MAKLFGIPRAIARSVIGTLFDSGYSRRGAFNLLKKEGVTYPSKNFRADWREITQGVRREQFFSAIPKSHRPTRAMMIEKAESVGSKYVYKYKVDLYDPKTKKTYTDLPYSIGQEKIRSIQSAEDELRDRLEGVSEEGLEYVRGRLINVQRR